MPEIINVPVIQADGSAAIEQMEAVRIIRHNGFFIAVVQRDLGYSVYEITTCGLLFTSMKYNKINREIEEYDFERAGWQELDRRIRSIAKSHPAYNFNLHIVTGEILQPRLSHPVY